MTNLSTPTEVPVMTESSDDTKGERSTSLFHGRKDLLIAVAVLGLLAGSLACFVFMSGSNGDVVTRKAGALSASWVGSGEDTDTVSDSGAQTQDETYTKVNDTPVGAPAKEDSPGVKHGTVQSGVPVIKSLTRFGLSMADAHSIITALDGVFDFRRSRPGHTFVVHFDEATGKPTYFRYDASLTRVYEVKLTNGKLVGSPKHIPTRKRIRRFGGTISSSLYRALKELGAHPTLTGKMVGVLANEVNFYKAQRPGDTFRVIVEEESLNGEFLGYGPVLALEYNGVKAGKRRFFRFQAGDAPATYYSSKGISVPKSAIAIPLHYSRISSPFGTRYHPVLKRKKMHNGTDFAAGYGTPVWSCLPGKVKFAANKGANGNLVAIDHGDGLSSYYAHLQRFASGIKSGTQVKARQVIGYVGSTGRSTGPHLHFGLKQNARFLDPLKYKIRPGRPVAGKYRAALKKVIADQGSLLDRTRIKAPTAPLKKDEEPAGDVLGDEDL